MSNQFSNYSFEQWCKDTNNIIYLELWNYKLNKKKPSEVGFSSKKKYWFNCKKNIHDPDCASILSITNAYKRNHEKYYNVCKKCNSFGQKVIDKYGEDYLYKIWSCKNECSPFDISYASRKAIWLKCLNDDTHPDYNLCAFTFWLTHGCPYCVGKKVCLTNSLGYMYPESIEYWSDKNEKTPFDYVSGSNQKVWWKCLENKGHYDYLREIDAQLRLENRCPECSKDLVKGENHYRWNGGISKENEKIRHSIPYRNWQKAVYSNDFSTCQCCGVTQKKLEAHHFKDFATYENLRFDVNNGISLCPECHNANIKGSFHNVCGTFKKTEQELEEYINNKRKQLGINIPFSIESYKNGNILKPGDVENASLGTWVFDKYSPSELRNNKTKNGFIKMKTRYRI